METQRMLLFVALAFVVLMLWEQWQRDYGPPPTPVSEFNDHPSTRSPAETGIDVPASPGARAGTDDDGDGSGTADLRAYRLVRN